MSFNPCSVNGTQLEACDKRQNGTPKLAAKSLGIDEGRLFRNSYEAPWICVGGRVRQQLDKNVQRFRGGIVFKAHRLLYHSTEGLRVIKRKREGRFRSRFRGFSAGTTSISIYGNHNNTVE